MSLYGFIKGIAGWCFRLLYPTKVFGPKKLEKKKMLFAFNHLSNLDPLVVVANMKPRFYFWAKKELFKKKFHAWFFKKMGVVPVDRSGADITSIKTALTLLKNENIFMLFPEGTRNKGNESEMLQIKNGLAMLAIKSQAPVRVGVFYRKPKLFKKNYLIISDEFSLEQFYGQRVNNELLAEASKIVEEKFDELHKMLEAQLVKKGVIKS